MQSASATLPRDYQDETAVARRSGEGSGNAPRKAAATRSYRYALATYCWTILWVLKNEALKAIAWRMTSSQRSRST